MRKTFFAILALIAISTSLSWLLGACRKSEHDTTTPLAQVLPAGFPAPVYTFSDNPLTSEGFELGRKLFYDGRLSIDGWHPCSSCHQQVGGFGTFDHDRSHGVFNSHTLRNAPVLFNLAWNNSFHWDGEFVSLQDEAAQPITGHIEMGEDFRRVIDKLEGDSYYARMFRKVFRTDEILPIHVQKALTQFTGYLVSSESKYDRYKRGQATFTPQEENGYQVYRTNCAGCHPEPLFTDNSFRNIGLPIDNFLNDYGRIRVTGKPGDSLKFKVPTLRNVYISNNYMHDGRFNTLAQVVNHYRTGVQASSTLDPAVAGGITLTNTEAANVVIFLRTLTDSTFIADPRFAKPIE